MTHENIVEPTIDMFKTLLRHARFGSMLTVENGDGRVCIIPAAQITTVHVESDRVRIVYASDAVDTFEFCKYTISRGGVNDDELIITED